MHALTRRYAIRDGISRAGWNEDLTLRVARRSINRGDRPYVDVFLKLLEWQEGLEQPADAYGLVHGDLHHGNFFVEESKITAFDFDDCCHHWFAYDLAVPWFTLCGEFRPLGVAFNEDKLFGIFLDGYAKTHTLSDRWIGRIGTFMAYRTVLLYHWFKTRLAEGDFRSGPN